MAINSSGADVPKATIVRLMIRAGTPSRKLRFTAPLTSASPEIKRIINPRTEKPQASILSPLALAGTIPFTNLKFTAVWAPVCNARHFFWQTNASKHAQDRHPNQKEYDDLINHVTGQIERRSIALQMTEMHLQKCDHQGAAPIPFSHHTGET